jgi:alpha-tubulin suppressor-like RCC1 family protein
MIRTLLARLIALAFLTRLTGCSSMTDTESDGIGTVSLLMHHLTTVPGAWIQQPALVRDTAGAVLHIQPEWISTEPTVATVDTTGAISVLASGTTRIVARLGTHADTLVIQAVPVRFTDVAVGSLVTCGTTVADDVFCWGSVAMFDSLTNVGPVFPGVRAPVKVARISGLQHLALGLEHLCASANGAALCWGGNRLGMLGLGASDTLFHPTPAVVPGFTFTALVAGEYFSCGLEAGGEARCWGYNGTGQLGDSSSGTIRPAPVAVRGGIAFRTLTAGQVHACALDAAGVAYCWGNGAAGAAGPAAGSESPVPVTVDTLLRFSAIDTWGEHTCGLTAAGAAWCWGLNGSWQLGALTSADHSADPVMVGGAVILTEITTGGGHSCGLTAAGAAWCWGDNGAGQIGNGQLGGRYSSPQTVVGGYAFGVLRAGGGVTCGITAGGRLYCWGADDWGQVGDGSDYSVHERPVPTEVVGQQ